MSPRRLLLTATAMAGAGALLYRLVPGPPELLSALTHPQHLAETTGAETVVLCLAGGLAGLVWCWGVLGLLVTAAGTLPGAAGAVGRLLARAVLPAGARRAAALALGVGIGLNGPWLAGTAVAGTTAAPVTASAPHGGAAPVPDWPVVTSAPGPGAPPAPAPVPDWPAPRPAGAHVVQRGDCLWTIAAGRLRADAGAAPRDAEIAAAVDAWWRANAGVIGPDPDLLLPGQVLRPPSAP
jgi:hypothetical protein